MLTLKGMRTRITDEPKTEEKEKKECTGCGNTIEGRAIETAPGKFYCNNKECFRPKRNW